MKNAMTGTGLKKPYADAQLATAASRYFHSAPLFLILFSLPVIPPSFILLSSSSASPLPYFRNTNNRKIVFYLLFISRLTADLSVPQQWGAWSGYFFCTDGSGLSFDPKNNTAFYCSSQKKYYTGEPYNKAWYTLKHSQV